LCLICRCECAADCVCFLFVCVSCGVVAILICLRCLGGFVYCGSFVQRRFAMFMDYLRLWLWVCGFACCFWVVLAA